MSKSAWKVVLLVVLVIVAVWWWRSRRRPPEVRLAAHFEDVCDIADRYATRPREGVDRLFAYLGESSPEMMEDFGDLLVAIERIDDDAAHDARAREAARRLQEPLIGCADELGRFGEAISEDPEASARFQRGVERLGTTLSILLGTDGARRLLPPQFTGMLLRSSPPEYQ